MLTRRSEKSTKQITFSTDLIYDVLRRYEPEHILLSVTSADAERDLLDIARLSQMLERFSGKFRYYALERASPMAVPVVVSRLAIRATSLVAGHSRRYATGSCSPRTP